jgi:hypothetical protein
MKPHPQAVHIKDWADGYQMQLWDTYAMCWRDFEKGACPIWMEDGKYRRKPAAPVIETKMTAKEAFELYRKAHNMAPSRSEWCDGTDCQIFANLALQRFIADGQVVTKEAHEAALIKLGDDLRDMARACIGRDMAVAGAVKERCVEVLRMLSQNAHNSGFNSPEFQIANVDLAAIIAKVKP